ncbi:hypothetical protein ACWGA9_40355 [Streptomyces sp. NPDC054950]|nr:hypothetical protein OV320_6831 [Actinobacteria bacterium OV320]
MVEGVELIDVIELIDVVEVVDETPKAGTLSDSGLRFISSGDRI